MTASLRVQDGAALRGTTTPRLWTRPLVTGAPGPCGCGCALTPATSRGFEAVDFATLVIGAELVPWQRWWLIHALEIRPDGTFRYGIVLTLIARQNGKTFLLKILALWVLYMLGARGDPTVLGVAQTLSMADEAWKGAIELAQRSPEMTAEIEQIRRGNNAPCFTVSGGNRYRTVAATPDAARGLSVVLLILDELRTQKTWDAWGALTKTTIAQLISLIVAISNAGEDESVVLNTLREQALAGEDDTLGIFEWSGPDGCALDDVDAILQANPSVGYTGLSLRKIALARATDPPGVYRTEVLCQRVPKLDMAIDASAWESCTDLTGTLATYRDRIALCVDVSLDERHVTLVGAAVVGDGQVRFEAMGAWESITEAEAALPAILEAVAPIEFGWFPDGPAAAMGATLRRLHLVTRRRAARVVKEAGGVRKLVLDDEQEFERITQSMQREACMGLAALVRAARASHGGDPLLTAHCLAAGKRPRGDGWVFARTDGGHVDGAYAVAGAVYLALKTPPPAPVTVSRAF